LSDLTQQIRTQLKSIDGDSRLVSINHLDELRVEISEKREESKWYKEFRKEYLAFDFQPPRTIPEAKSIIITAMRQPIINASFVLNGRISRVIVPPGYSTSEYDKLENALLDLLKPLGYKLERAKLPLKLLAVHSGLAEYGKNNIAYVPGMGSYLRLAAFYSDLPCSGDSWEPVRAMDECAVCNTCIELCPSAAISAEYFPIYPQKCITYYNERSEAFPAWIDSSWHNCLLGCMNCQEYCPKNIETSPWMDTVEFNAEETALLFQGVAYDDLPQSMIQRVKHCGLQYALDIFPRNFGLLNKAKIKVSERSNQAADK
jgi:epoxyqueuosine reductase